MKDLNYVSGEINKKNNLEVNLPKYANSMISLYNGLAYIKLSMNYFTLYEMMSDDECNSAVDDRLMDIVNEINLIIEREVINSSDVKSLENSVAQVDNIRNEIIEIMEVVTSYVDKLRIYEYVLNRVEYRFSEEEPDEKYYGTYLTNDLMHYILSDKDRMVVNSKISEVVGQLPVRISKGKFYEYLKGAFSLYYGAQEGTVDDFVYSLRTVSMLDEPKGFEEYFPEVNVVYGMLRSADYKNMDNEQFKKLSDALFIAAERMTEAADLYVMAAQIVNDLYTILLSKMHAFCDVDEVGKAVYVIDKVHAAFQNGDSSTEDEKIFDAFTSFEGKQEKILSSVSENDFAVDFALKSMPEMLQSLMMDKIYHSLSVIIKLQSGSDFVLLNADQDKMIEADREHVDKACNNLIEELDAFFKEQSQTVNRAVMASLLGQLPVFFNNVDEIQNYINTSLTQCNDISERKATIEIMKILLFGNDYKEFNGNPEEEL